MERNEVIRKVSESLSISEEDAELVVSKAEIGDEVESSLENWLNNRFLPNVVFIDQQGYAQMCIDALKILGKTAATDYGGSRQRDLGHLWADMTRGYLGELAFKLFLKQKWNVEVYLDHEVGELRDYLPTDIHKVKKQGENERPPRIKVGLKTTKWNGIWLDIPGDQFNHSDVHMLIKVGTGRDHLFAYFKSISVFKDKVLKVGRDLGLLSVEESELLFEKLPSFNLIPAYICGFVWKNRDYEPLSYSGRKGRMHYTITGWNGPIRPGDLERIKEQESITTRGAVKFKGIGRFTHDSGYLFNAGNLRWSDDEWRGVIESM